MKSAQSMTVSRHVQSVRSVHRRGNPPQERLRNWQVRQHDTATRGPSSAPHSHISSPSLILPLRGRFLLALQPSRERERGYPRSPQRRISLCISSRRATCETRVPHETLYLTAFVSPMSEKRSRPFTYLLPPCYYPCILFFFFFSLREIFEIILKDSKCLSRRTMV